MKAVRFHEYGDAGVLRYEDAALPEPGPGEVRVRVAASTFNPVDDGLRGGWLRDAFPMSLPHVPGVEVSGTVDALGPDARGLDVGDAIVGFLPMTADGAAAEHVVAPIEALVSAPVSIPLADAAALPMVALTAYQALFDDAGLRAGQRVLINGAGGAVGGYAVQLARHAGAHVIGTASPRSVARVRAAGADEVVDHTAAAVTTAEPVDVLVNLARIDAERLRELSELVRDGGVVVNSVPAVPTPSDEARGVRAVGVLVRSDAEQLSRLVAMVDRGELRVEVAERVPLADLHRVHARAAAGEPIARTVVLP
ncbi:NADP-dependent oxidoreductase [Patulibacter sp.]|uniref:NADP-dependent oxidoreductase n=1 Tax=Patulibacter sp. TaxID=1912859 RepID=UPI00271B382D|nr:NADP-dependent oxidoreductase [Patulibacter sp.]MDO9408840.1 NADP-dependent oxidoreductase [Patulibacter sp.]